MRAVLSLASTQFSGTRGLGFRLLPSVALALPFLDFPGIGGGAYVKPLALPLAVIALALMLLTSPQTIRIKLDLPMRLSICLGVWAVIGSLVFPWVIGVPDEVKGQTLPFRIARDLLSLSGGLLFWFYLRIAITSDSQTASAVRWMLRTFWIVLPFAAVQILIVLTDSATLRDLDRLLGVVRATKGEFGGRVFALAPEASMLADQLLSMYLPFTIAALLLGTSLFRRRLGGLRAEVWIFSLSAVLLIFTQSRIGLVALLFLVACGFVVTTGHRHQRKHRRRRVAFLLAGVLSVPIAVATFAGEQASQFFATFSGVDDSTEGGVWSNVTRLGSMSAGFDMALSHPLGVGTGAFPFLFERHVPDWALISPEIQALLGNYGYYVTNIGNDGGDIDTRLPDAKALPARVAAELGVPGLLIFGSLWWVLLRRCRRVFRDPARNTESRVVALGAMLSLLTMLPLSFSINSYVWVHWIYIAALAAVVGKLTHPMARQDVSSGMRRIA